MSNPEFDYQWQKLHANPVPKADIKVWQAKFGPKVVERDKKGVAIKVEFSVLVDNKSAKVYIVGAFNNWGSDKGNLEPFRMQLDDDGLFAKIVVDFIKHEDEYKFMVTYDDGAYFNYFEDPACAYFADNGNCIFWDFEDPSSYKQQCPLIDNRNRSVKIMQTDLPGLVVHFADANGTCGKDIYEKNLYQFIANCGVIEKIKELGFNCIQFLPFAQSIDGSNWKLRYLVPFQYAIQKNWGTPDDFARMVDEFHKAGIAVIGDFVLGHLPDRNFKIFGQSSDSHGLHLWKKKDGALVYMKDETSWGSRRVDFDNAHVRDFFISSCLHFMKNYRIDGFRIDNVDGILRYGDTGEGDERANGRIFLRELNAAIYSYNPLAMVNYESHYYYGDNSKMLVAPLDSTERALGATAYNGSRLTYFFHTDYMLKAVDEVSVWKFKHIADEMEWGKSNSTIADFHNHDAAAGLMEMRATGSYAYDTMTVKAPENHIHAVGKIKTMEAAISFFGEGRTLDLLQTFLLQTGTFEHDSSIRWFLAFNESSRNMLEFKKKVNLLMDNAAFWPENTNGRSYLNVDDKQKVVVVERVARNNAEDVIERFVIVVNFSAFKHHNYKIGLMTDRDYEVVFNSDEFAYCGFGMASYPKVLKNNPSKSFELLSREVELGVLAPYGVVVLKEM